jgi:hypothetical protein
MRAILPVLVMTAGLVSCRPAHCDDAKAKAEAAVAFAQAQAKARQRQAGGSGPVFGDGHGAQRQHQAPVPLPPVYYASPVYYQPAPVYGVTQWWNGWGNAGVNCVGGG